MNWEEREDSEDRDREMPPTRRMSAENDQKRHNGLGDVSFSNMFRKYDRNKSGFIEIQELKQVMSDLGQIQLSRPTSVWYANVIATMRKFDLDGDDRLNPDEFASFYSEATAPRLYEVLECSEPEKAKKLREKYRNFAVFGKGWNSTPSHAENTYQKRRSSSGDSADNGALKRGMGQSKTPVMMGTAHWMKLCRDTGLVGGQGKMTMNSVDADLIFAKVKNRGSVRIDYENFVDALGLVAEKLRVDLKDIVDQVISEDKLPTLNTKLASFSINGDSHMLYKSLTDTSVLSDPYKPEFLEESQDYATNVRESAGKTIELECDCGPSELNRQAHQAVKIGSPTATATDIAEDKIKAFEIKKSSRRHSESSSEGSAPSLSTVPPSVIEEVGIKFGHFAGFGNPSATILSPLQREMDSKQFAKICKDSGLSKCSADYAAVDLAFAKARSKKGRRLCFADFLVALALLAGDMHVPETEVLNKIATCSGPRRNSNTPLEYVSLHDDLSKYTGMYKRDAHRLSDPFPAGQRAI